MSIHLLPRVEWLVVTQSNSLQKDVKNPDGSLRFTVSEINAIPIGGYALQLIAMLVFAWLSSRTGKRATWIVVQLVSPFLVPIQDTDIPTLSAVMELTSPYRSSRSSGVSYSPPGQLLSGSRCLPTSCCGSTMPLDRSSSCVIRCQYLAQGLALTTTGVDGRLVSVSRGTQHHCRRSRYFRLCHRLLRQWSVPCHVLSLSNANDG